MAASVYAFFGIQGSGKGTQAKLLAEEFLLKHISMGDMLREMAASGSLLGQNVKELIDAGNLVPNEIIVQVAEERLQKPDCIHGIVLDGFIRTDVQAVAIDAMLKSIGKPLTAAVLIDLPEAEIFSRLNDRLSCPVDGSVYNLKTAPPKQAGICDQCGANLLQRADDMDTEFIKTRIQHFYDSTGKAIEYFRSLNKLISVNGCQHIAAVYRELKSKLGL